MPRSSAKSLIKDFQRVVESPHEYAKSLKGRGRLVAGYMCTHVPEEILYAAGIVPVRVLSSHVSQAMSRSYLHETYCSFSHDCAYQGLQHNYDYLDLVVTGSSCLHMSEAFNIWVRFAGFQGKSFLIAYPHIMHTKPGHQFLVQSFSEFKQFVEQLSNRSVAHDDLQKAIVTYNRSRRLLKRLWELLRLDSPPLTGKEAADVTLASQLMDKQEFNDMMERLIRRLETVPGKTTPGVRLMAAGGACDHSGILELTEKLDYNTNLVFVDSCTATRYFWFEVPENRPDKLDAIAEGYLSRIPCPAKDNVLGTGEKERFRYIQQFVRDFRPDGVVLIYQRFCSPQPMDIVGLKPILDKLGIPSTEIELDTTIPAAQFGTQMEALVEVIKRVAPGD